MASVEGDDRVKMRKKKVFYFEGTAQVTQERYNVLEILGAGGLEAFALAMAAYDRAGVVAMPGDGIRRSAT
ncbi:hypothetical protein EC973_003663 [Apophysomyces ossiformis]|uniref:Uncharacterized protein n=1 Tax=Apophysomyces ossiformis TaxID=679940 RepID=A0A8H7ELY0_9FUNG|nr:hypothetical protein EC973_003663 [Apophysomyces ossiformis]